MPVPNRPCIQWGNAVDHGVNSFQTARAISILRAITGNLDVILAVTCYHLIPWPGRGLLISLCAIGSDRRCGRNGSAPNKTSCPSFGVCCPKSLINAIIDENPYPVRGLYVHASNPLMTYTNAGRTYQALKKLDFLAVSDFFSDSHRSPGGYCVAGRHLS